MNLGREHRSSKQGMNCLTRHADSVLNGDTYEH